MKKIFLSCLFIWLTGSTYAQAPNPDRKFSAPELKADLSFLKLQLFNAHADPFTELSRADYEKVFDGINRQLTDSMTATAFYKTIKPAMAPLSDEHAQISIAAPLQTEAYKNGETFLPFSLSKQGNNYQVDELLIANTGLQKGEIITQVDGQPIATLVLRCANYTIGFASQRAQNALEQFGYLYTLSTPGTATGFKVKNESGKIINVSGARFKFWQDYVLRKAGQTGVQDKSLSYTRYGDAGYINARGFDARNDKDLDSIKRQIAGIFRQIKTDGVKALFIDVSRNSGGNSQVGNILIDYFYDKPYRSYQCNWKRSEEYLNLMKSWGANNSYYTSQPVGKVIHFDSSDNPPSNPNPDRFKGKVYVMVGNGTFSSAIMFATIVKDNHIAELIGQVPSNGHPNHFGELYATKLPNTKLDVRFGVKEWIRPAGKTGENILQPDILVDMDKPIPELIKTLVK